MKRDSLFRSGRRHLPTLVCAALLVTTLVVAHNGRATASHEAAPPSDADAATAAAVQPVQRPWTAVASTGTVDEAFTNIAAVGIFVQSDLGFRPGSPANGLLARYNVTNTFDNSGNPNVPGWTTLEVGGIAPGNSSVTASLFQIERCSGRIIPPPNQPANSPLCTVTINNAPVPTCRTCALNGPVNFGNFLYFVEVRISRPNPALQPRAMTLRVF